MSGGLLPVQFDAAAAEEAAHQLVVTAESLMQCREVLNKDYPAVTEDWNGHFRDTFDDQFPEATTSCWVLFDAFLQLAALIRAKSWEAQAAQAAFRRQQEDE